MTTATLVTPEQLLASEPVRKDGLKTPMRKEGDRTITFTWQVGEGDLWKQTYGDNERVAFTAVLEITHHKKGMGAAAYTATLWQHSGNGVMFDGRNGLRVFTDFAGAGRFSLNKLQGFAPYALAALRKRGDEDDVLAYFKPERV